MRRRIVRLGEALAIQPDHVHAGPKAMWWDYWAPPLENERVGANLDIAVVRVEGALDYRKGYGGCSYESVLDRVRIAFTGEDVVERFEREQRYAAEPEEAPPATPPKAVVLRIDSPGGAVSGLNETVFALQRMAARNDIPLIAYVDEMATSAAYALACACEQIVIPPSGICGSIGVISMMADATAADEKMGLRVAVITSGARKADGNPHTPLTDAAISAEQKRVDQFAMQFFRLVASARPLSVDDIKGKQARIYVGNEGIKAGLADALMGWDKLVETLDDDSPEQKPIDKSGTRGSGSNGTTGTTSAKTETPMSLLALTALVKSTKDRIAKAKDPKRKAALATALAAAEAALAEFKKVKHTKETHEEESSDEGEEAEEGEEAAEDDDGGGDDEDEPEDDDEDEGEEAASEDDAKTKKAKTAKTAAAVYSALVEATGTKGKGLVGAVKALVEKAGKFDAMSADVSKLKATQLKATKNALVDEAVAQRRITRKQAADLRSAKLSFVRGFLAMHKSPLVNIDEEAAHMPDNTPDADVPAASKKMVEQSIVAQGLSGEKAEAFRKQAYADHRERMSKTNGAGVY